MTMIYNLRIIFGAIVLVALLVTGANSLVTPSSRTVLVTGGNKGIGLAICHRILDRHPDVLLLLGSRNLGRGERAVEDLTRSNPSFVGRVSVVEMDVSSDDSVKAAAASYPGELAGIVNNAGIIGKSFDDTIAVNYFGQRRVNDAFGPKLCRPGGRIVNIASASGPMFVSACGAKALRQKLSDPLSSFDGGISELDDLAKSYFGQMDYGNDAYGLSKAFVNAYTMLHAKEEPELVINSCSPGFIKTDMTIKAGLGASNPPEMGAFAPVELLMSSNFEGLPTGRYYGSDAVRSPLDRYRGPGDPPFEGP